MLLLYPNRHHILTADQHAPYRQQADFLYYTHIAVPGCRAIVFEDKKYIFLPDRDEHRILREGELITVEQVQFLNPGATIHRISQREEVLMSLVEKYQPKQVLYNLDGVNYDAIQDIDYLMSLLPSSCKGYIPLRVEGLGVRTYRAIKSFDEIAKIRRAQQITLEAIEYATQDIKPGMREYEIAAKLSYYYASRWYTDSFPPIVASGKNACTLHYSANDSQIQDGDLLLIDTGAYVDGYCGDCSRSSIIGENREDSENREVLLAIVKQAHDDCVGYVRPGLTMKDFHQYAVQRFEYYFWVNNLERKKEYFPHGIGHSIGLDVHDPLSKNRPLEVGMCITIEPWLYIPEQGIGMRWENIVVLIEGGCEVLV